MKIKFPERALPVLDVSIRKALSGRRFGKMLVGLPPAQQKLHEKASKETFLCFRRAVDALVIRYLRELVG